MELDGKFDGQRVLVVGGAGFVGSNLVKMVLSQNANVQVEVVDNLMSSETENLPTSKNLKFIKGSIAHDSVLMQISDNFDYVFHLATFHGNQSSIHDPIKDHENNTLTTLKLMNHCKDFKRLKKMVYSSAGCSAAKKTFDAAEETTEEAPISLTQDSPYSISKVIGEFYAVYFHKQHKLPTVRARFQNVYGPGEVLGAGEWRGTPATVWRNVTPTFIFKSLHGERLPLQNGGEGTRDFIFVDDICRGLLLAGLRGNAGDVYNLASGQETSVLELATVINEFTGNKAGVEIQPKRDWDTSGKRFGSTTKSYTELGFRATVPLREGLGRTVAWTVENMKFIDKNVKKHDRYMNG